MGTPEQKFKIHPRAVAGGVGLRDRVDPVKRFFSSTKSRPEWAAFVFLTSQLSHGKFQQAENIDPEHTHEVPIPARDLCHDAPVLHGFAEQGCEACIEQNENAN